MQSETYKVTEKSSTYKTSNFVTSNESGARESPSFMSARRPHSPGTENRKLFLSLTEIIVSTDAVDHSSNIRVSKGNAGRRDSWDVINKTKHLLSSNSLESLANMTQSQLNTDLSYSRPHDLDTETERNTQYNKFALAEKQRMEARRNSEEYERQQRMYS